jgi:cytochrome c556
MRRFEKGAPFITGNSAALVAIGQGSMPNADETEAPDKVAEWYKYCIQMRDAAGALNKAVHAKNEDAAKEAMEALQQSCDDCHAVFHQDDH